MASLLSRFIASFDAIKPVPNLTGLDGEFNQQVGASGVFNGGTTAFKLLTKTSDGSDPVYEFDQVGAGPIIECKQNGTLLASVNNSGQIVSAVTTGTAPFSVASTTQVSNLNPDRVGGILATNLAKLDTHKIYFSLAFKIDDPSTFALNDDSQLVLVKIPVITGGFLTKITIIRASGSHTSGGSVTFAARKFNDSTIGSGVSFNDTNNAANTPYTEDFADTAIVENNFITVRITARSGTVSERNVSINVEGYRLLNA